MTVPCDRARRLTRGSEGRPPSPRSTWRADPRQLRRGRPVSTGSAARGRSTRGPVRARRGPRPRSRDGRRVPDRTCRRRRRSRSLVTRPFAPLHLETADSDGVTLLGAERAQLALDPCADELSLKVGRRVRRLPVDARREPHHAIAFDPEGFAFALHLPIAPSSREGNAPLAGRRRAHGVTWWAAIEDLAKKVVSALSRRGRNRHARNAAFGERAR